MDQKTAPQPSAYLSPENEAQRLILAFARGEISYREYMDRFPRSPLPPCPFRDEQRGRPQ